jgi:Holliday junction resolvasome RuvABC endonuclease subunit
MGLIFVAKKSLNKYIYGLDLSMSCVGVAIFDENMSIIKVCSIETKPKQSHGERLKDIADFMYKLKQEYPPKVVSIERGFARFNTATAVVYRVHGLINYVFYDIKQVYYPPKTVKEAILKGNATKKEVQGMILKLYPDIIFSNEDESDATAVALTYFYKK